MHLIAPDILADAVKLSAPVCGVALAVGLLLWLTGWCLHRFWIVTAVTVAAGVIGLHSGRALGVQLIVAGLLLALAAGLMAMELAKLLVFAAGGAGAWLAVRAVVPAAQDPVVAFLVGGVVAVMLFRLWVMLLTSLAGTLVVWYAGLSLAARLLKLEPLDFLDRRGVWVDAAVAGGTLLGLALQAALARARRKPDKKDSKPAKLRKADNFREPIEPPHLAA